MIPALTPIIEIVKPPVDTGSSDENPFNIGTSPLFKMTDLKEEISKLDSFDLSTERRVEEIVNEILAQLISKEVKDGSLFPQRALSKVV